jgi:hypothetical protein
MNLRESRVLAAVQRLGTPTSIEVAEACQCTTTEARGHLRDLAEQGRIRSEGRGWTVPSVALDTISPDLDWPDEQMVEVGPGCALMACVLILIVALGIVGIVFAIKGLING